jgi:hypothetical protein
MAKGSIINQRKKKITAIWEIFYHTKTHFPLLHLMKTKFCSEVLLPDSMPFLNSRKLQKSIKNNVFGHIL